MNRYSKELLRVIGQQLDRSIFPRVKNGGFVVPSDLHVPFQPMGKEKQNAAERQRRSATESRTGPQGGQGASCKSWAAGGSWPSGAPSPLLDAVGGSAYQAELGAVCEAYPGARIWGQGEDFWLLVESSLLQNLPRKVYFLVAVSTTNQLVRAWAFWNSCAVGVTWIGPRHTNFPDGSICAFEPRDGTWQFGDSLVTLLDIYSLWALRHLHYEVFGRWPGPQSVTPPYERMLELHDDEYCGCGQSQKLYTECCKPIDNKRKLLAAAVSFGFFSAFTVRNPPKPVVQFMLMMEFPPSIPNLLNGANNNVPVER